MHDRTRPVTSSEPYPDYDVLNKCSGPSWNDQTRAVVARRLAIASEPRFFTVPEFETVSAIAARILPQPADGPGVPVAALLDSKLQEGTCDGYRVAGMPRDREAWRQGLKAIDAEAQLAYQRRFNEITEAEQDELLRRAEAGALTDSEWGTMRSADFFKRRLLRDIVLVYYAHPTAWSEIGWGGPASPRGYVRLDFNERDPWEAAEAKPGAEDKAARINRHVR
ncbi:gluconate 2-dehydrogenase subunit 3 family protein [Bradyrhizobium canariense]|uniref:gluconate 2-dehydrogenase subunit 3 family protein n=1 Tax=Bradyrhizobium canariense TaxID=255045 RepID=UPI00195BF2CC|nr:gluconate 2-dehydrogenase subunit 3 family protein [Bradyrhizobium canariense]MBM7485973.1 hypothetical protein [Bradyrhizobium canariense]